MLQKRVNLERAKEGFVETVRQILDKRWMEKREKIKNKILSGTYPEEEVMKLARQFDELKRNRPQLSSIFEQNLLEK